MNDAEAAQQLQTIRTLMERAALYRRALGPILLTAGTIGLVSAVLGCLLQIDSVWGFLVLWASAAVLAVLSTLLLVRRQALRAQEPFWTPPTRRIVSAMCPALFAGAIAAVALAVVRVEGRSLVPLLPYVWSVCYGLALHSAGFFTLRGIRNLGWGFVIAGGLNGLPAFGLPGYQSFLLAHVIMGALFGFGHLVAGGKLLVEERYSIA